MIDDFSKVVGLDCAKNAKEELAIGKFAWVLLESWQVLSD
jgi:hypothetical protein